MTIDVSIVIPTYNQDPLFLQRAIETSLNQSYPKNRYEIIVVDDGSIRIPPDFVLKKFEQEQNLRLIKKPHGRIAHTLNVGIRSMQGKYFKWLSSDDELLKDSIEIFMAETRNNEAILYGDWLKIDENSHVIGVFNEPVFETMEKAKEHLWRSYFGNSTASLIPRSAFKKVGLFDSSLPYFEDYDWWLRAMFLFNYTFKPVKKVVAKYRYSETQLTSKTEHFTINRALLNWMIKKRVYNALSGSDRLVISSPPNVRLFYRQLLLFQAIAFYNHYNRIFNKGKTPVSTALGQLTRKFLRVN